MQRADRALAVGVISVAVILLLTMLFCLYESGSFDLPTRKGNAEQRNKARRMDRTLSC